MLEALAAVEAAQRQMALGDIGNVPFFNALVTSYL